MVTAVLIRSSHTPHPPLCLPGLLSLPAPGSGLFSDLPKEDGFLQGHLGEPCRAELGLGTLRILLPSVSLASSSPPLSASAPPASFPMTSYSILVSSRRWTSEANPEMKMHIPVAVWEVIPGNTRKWERM